MTAQPLFDQQKPEQPTTARHMLDLLQAHYLAPNRPPAGIFAPEIEAPGGKRRADLIWQGCTAAAGAQLVGHEIKVTRADLLAELADGTKSDPWQRYCHRWWLVVPSRALIDGVDLPPTWGVMAPPSGRRTRSMTVLVDAPQLRPDDPAPALRKLAVWLHWRAHNLELAVAERDRERERLREINRKLRLDARPMTDDQQNEQRIVADIVSRLGGVSYRNRIGDWSESVSIDDVVAALADLGSLRGRAERIGYEIERAARGITEALSAVDQAKVLELRSAVARFATAGGGS